MNTKSARSNPATALQQLRATFPRWGILYNPFAYQWIALRTRYPTLSADTPEDLARRIGRHEPPPSATSRGIHRPHPD